MAGPDGQPVRDSVGTDMVESGAEGSGKKQGLGQGLGKQHPSENGRREQEDWMGSESEEDSEDEAAHVPDYVDAVDWNAVRTADVNDVRTSEGLLLLIALVFHSVTREI